MSKMSPRGLRIKLICPCGRVFEVMPYLAKRKRLCSRACVYRHANRRTEIPLLRKWKNLTHLDGKYHPLHGVWRGMMGRCHKPQLKSYSDYGAKGIRVCEEWHDWDKFHDWAIQNGYKRGLWIDRRRNSEGYSPDNCRWITPKENQENRGNVRAIQVRRPDGSLIIVPDTVDAANLIGVCYNTVRNYLVGKVKRSVISEQGYSLSYA